MQKKLTYKTGGIVIQEQERFMQTEINIVLGKNGDYMPSSLGGKLISVGRQAVRLKFLQFNNFKSVKSKA